MQCRVFSSFIKFKIGPIPGGEEEGRGKERDRKAASIVLNHIRKWEISLSLSLCLSSIVILGGSDML